MVAELQTVSKIAYGGRLRGGSDGQHQLVLLRLQAGRSGGVFAETQERTDLVTELRKSLVFAGGDIGRQHLYRITICFGPRGVPSLQI